MDFIRFLNTEKRINAIDILSYEPSQSHSQRIPGGSAETSYGILIKFHSGKAEDYPFSSKKTRDASLKQLDALLNLTSL